MACYAKKVVDTAMAEIGCKESGINITKYAAWIDKNYPDFYNTEKQGAEWCDLFVDYCVLMNSDDEKEAEYVLCQPKKSCGAGCSFSYDYYKQNGRVGNEPKYGAQIFFGTGKKPKHTGIVVDIQGDSVITVEGNSDNMVKRHTYKQNSSRIFGYGYPRYTEEVEEKPIEEPTAPVKSIDEIADEVIAGKWGNGSERKQRLSEAGYNPSEVQAKVNEKLGGTSQDGAKTTSMYRVKTNTGLPLRLRKKPNTNCEVLARMKNGSQVEVHAIENGWAKVSYNGKEGYCALPYLVKE